MCSGAKINKFTLKNRVEILERLEQRLDKLNHDFNTRHNNVWIMATYDNKHL